MRIKVRRYLLRGGIVLLGIVPRFRHSNRGVPGIVAIY
jgi:hypothetical protein